MSRKVSFYTLGCKVNQYDTEMMKEKVREKYKLVPFGPEADIYVINTCTVTGNADSKSRKYIRRASRWGGFVVVTGCYPVLNEEEVESIEGVDFIITNRMKNNILSVIENKDRVTEKDLKCSWNLAEQKITRDTQHTRAFLKIQDGCDKECSYCKVRYVRGPSRSKAPATVLEEVDNLVENGYKEIVLTGIDLADYGKESGDLAELIRDIALKKGLERLRLSSINTDGINPELVEVYKERKELCPHFHIPLQSGSDKILKSMNRGYTSGAYLEKINYLKDNIPHVTFGTDILIGYPGETNRDVQATEEVVKNVGFLNYHIFPFSPRNPTLGASLPDKIDHQTKKRREKRLEEICKRKSKEERERFTGTKRELLLEKKSSKTGSWRGYTKNYLDLHLPSLNGEGYCEGDSLQVEVEKISEDHCLGSVVT